jgi:hypothetical protein
MKAVIHQLKIAKCFVKMIIELKAGNKLKLLVNKIEPKVNAYGFLKE